MQYVVSRARRSLVTALGFCAAFLIASCGEEVLAPSVENYSAGVPIFAFSAEFNQYQFLGFVPDDQGVNDTPAQSDLNAFTRADNVSGKIGVKWIWDDVNSWTGSGQTGDACALFDTTPSTANKGKGMADFAVCVRISNPNGDPLVVSQLASPASPLLYSCGDTKAERCASSVKSLPIGAIKCEVEKVPGDFLAGGDDSADVYAACSIPLSVFNTTTAPNLLNVCSYPSGSPNSNPFDCVVTPGAGFLTIKKATTPQNSGEIFSFTITPAPAGGASHSLKDSTTGVEQTGLISALPGTKAFKIAETSIPSTWTLDAASCAFDRTGSPATGTKIGSSIDSISVESGETTVCTFTNSLKGGTIELKKIWGGTAGQTTLKIGTTVGGSETASQLTGAAGAAPLTTTAQSVSPGTYYVSESGGLGDYSAQLACTNKGNPITPGSNNSIAVVSDDVVVCTFTNTRNQGSIELKKTWSGTPSQTTLKIGTAEGGTQVASQLTGAAGAAPLTTTAQTVNTGTYYVSETALSDYSSQLACTSDGNPITPGAGNSVTVGANAVVVCTFTNTRAQGSIELKKVWSGTGGQTTLKIGTSVGTSEIASQLTGVSGAAPLSTGAQGVNTGTYYVSESGGLAAYTPSLACTSGGNPVTPGTGNSLVVGVGAVVVCTFTNTVIPPTISVVKTAGSPTVVETGGNVTYSVVVTNTSPIAITLTSLVDDKFGNLSGQGTCNGTGNLYGSIAVGGTYSCSFTGALAASNAGQIHVNEVTASASSDVGPATAKDTAKVTYSDVLPNISVVKSADFISIAAVGGDSVANFAQDVRFSRIGIGGGAGGGAVFANDVCDDGGVNDINAAQSDLNCFSRADNVTGRLGLRWTWDAVSQWTGAGQTGDACALLNTTTNDGNANFAFCVRITNPNGDANAIAQAVGSPVLYKCKDTAADRCASPNSILTLTNSVCTVAKVGNKMTGGEDDGDIEATCDVNLADLGNGISIADIALLNVCSFPSGSPGSNAFDCVISPAAGLLVIVESTTPSNADAYFGFTLRNSLNGAGAAATNGDNQWEVQGGATSAGLPILPGDYAVVQSLPTNWTLGSISCSRNGQSVGTSDLANLAKLTIPIVSGSTTTCTFTNSLTASQTITFTVLVTNNSLEAATLDSLSDTENPDDTTPTYVTLNGVGDCATGGSVSIAGNGGTYTCQFTRTVSGVPGTTHKDKVKATGKDGENNRDTKISNKVTVTIN